MTDPIYHWSNDEGFVTIADGTTLSWEDSRQFLLDQSEAGPTTYVHKSELAYGLAAHLRVLLSAYK